MKADPGEHALLYPPEEILVEGLFFHLPQRLPYKLHRIVEDDREQAFLTAEILEKRSLGNAHTFHHAIDARLPEPVA